MTGLLIGLVAVVCGGVGSVARYLVDDWLRRGRWSLPWATLAVNVIGSLLLGLVAASGSSVTLVVVGTGFCGGLTTLSTASVEALQILAEKKVATAVGWVLAQALSCVAAASAGLLLIGPAL